MKYRSNRRSKACDISPKVRQTVWLRDKGRCVVCGNAYNVAPNAHYISRQRGGLGIEQNIVTLCSNFTDNQCHRRFDGGTKAEREELDAKIWNYLQEHYPGLKKDDLIFKKWWQEGEATSDGETK